MTHPHVVQMIQCQPLDAHEFNQPLARSSDAGARPIDVADWTSIDRLSVDPHVYDLHNNRPGI